MAPNPERWRAGWVYFGMIYALGFLLGAMREMWLTPRFGPFWPRMVELPLMLAASWVCAWWVVNRYGLEMRRDRLVMGLSAFALLMIGEALVGTLAMGRSLGQHLASSATLQGVIGLAAQCAFALFPLFVRLMPEEPATTDVR
jgi:hypothetical protein